jgi:hypothetical protein
MEEDKKINIDGKHNKYLIRKACNIKQQERKIKEYNEELIDYDLQCKNINMIYLEQDISNNEIQKYIVTEINKKISGYKQQDIKKEKLNIKKFVTIDDILEKIVICKLKCFYCDSNMLIVFNDYKYEKQWTLDRINNDSGHNRDNILISCLECNLKRGNMKKDLFEFTKKMKIVKI